MQRKSIGDSLVIHEGIVEKGDLNGYGLMHGGRLLTLCDEVGYLAAMKHCSCDCLTRAAHDIHFTASIREGDPYAVEAIVALTGSRTLWVQCHVRHEKKSIMSAVFVYIAVDSGLKSIAVPHIFPASDKEKAEQERMIRLRNRVMEK